MTLAQLARRATQDFDRVLQRRFARDADGFARNGVEGDVPEAGARYCELGREGIKRAAVISVSAAVFEAAKVRIAHHADVAGLRRLDDDDVVFI